MKTTAVAVELLLFAFPLVAAVRGTAVTPDGVPIPAVNVKLYAAMPQSERMAKLLAGETLEPLVSAQADAKGNFNLEVAREGNYIAQLTADGHAPASFRTNGMEDVAGIALRPATSKRGRVTANGAPVAKATLLFTSGDASLFVRSDDEGKYAVPDPKQWEPSVIAFHPDYARLSVQPTRRQLELDLKLTPGVTLRGRVLGPDGKTGAKAKLAVDGVVFGESNDDGSFALVHVPNTWRVLRATSGSLAAQAARGNAETLRLAPALSFTGSVVDAKSRLPIAGANVALQSGGASEDAVAEGVADEKGRFSIGPLLPGQYTLVLASAGYAISYGPQTVAAGMVPKTLYLRRDARVSGRIADEERTPVAGARVTFARAYVFGGENHARVSAPDGRYAFRIASAEGGEMDLMAMKRGYASATVRGQKLASGDDKRVDFELSRGIAVSGQVFGPEGEPLRGVSVASAEFVDRSFYTSLPDPRDGVETDDEGKFELRLRPATWNLHATADGFVRKVVRQVKVEPGLAPLRIDLERGVAIRGRVVYAGGEPGAHLEVYANAEGFPVHASTDEGGAFVLDGLAAKSVVVSVSSDDGTILEERPVTAPADNVLIELAPTVKVSGRVLAAANTRAVTDFQLEVRAPRESGAYYGGPGMQRDVHDSEGKFVLERVFIRPSELEVTAPGFAPSVVALPLEKGKDLSDIEVTLAPGSRVSGRVTAATGAPADGVQVQWAGSGKPGWSSDDAVITDANGDYAIDGIPYGEQTLVFTKRGAVPARKTLTIDAAETRLDVQLAAGRSLPGRVVTDSGAPVAGARIAAMGENGWNSATSDDAGRFTLEGLASGIYRFRAEKTGFASATLQNVDIERLSELTLTLSSGATITGRVLGLSPEQLANVTIMAADPQTQSTHSGAPDASGSYRLEGAPVGHIRIRAIFRGGDRSRASDFVYLETQAGGTYKADLEFLEHNTIRGRVTRNGVPVRGGRISFVPKVPPRTSGSGTIGNDGEYEVQGVPAGEMSVYVLSFAENYRYSTSTTVRGSGTIDFDLKPATLSGSVVDETSDQPLAGAAVELESTDPTVEDFGRTGGASGADGRFIIANIVPGSYLVRTSRDGYASNVGERTIGEGANVDVTVRLAPTAGVALRVTDARTGQPLRAFVSAFGADGSVVWRGAPELKADGTARVPLAPGRHRVLLWSSGFGLTYATLTSPGSHEIALRPGGKVQVENSSSTPFRAIVLAADGTPYDIEARDTKLELTLGPGPTWLTDLAAGTYTLQLLDDRGVPTRSVPFAVTEGGTTRVDL